MTELQTLLAIINCNIYVNGIPVENGSTGKFRLLEMVNKALEIYNESDIIKRSELISNALSYYNMPSLDKLLEFIQNSIIDHNISDLDTMLELNKLAIKNIKICGEIINTSKFIDNKTTNNRYNINETDENYKITSILSYVKILKNIIYKDSNINIYLKEIYGILNKNEINLIEYLANYGPIHIRDIIDLFGHSINILNDTEISIPCMFKTKIGFEILSEIGGKLYNYIIENHKDIT